MENALEVCDLSKTYKKSNFNLSNISFSLTKGSIMGFVGKNGAGKSTTIKAILDLIEIDSGTIYINGQQLNQSNKMMKEDIGVVFDQNHFSGELTIKKLEKVLGDIYQNWNPTRFFQYVTKFNLPTNQKISKFSRGMMMKLSISVALSHEAKLLILDEATAGLDPVAREEVLDVLLEFVEDENNAILMSSHISSDLEKICDYITFIDQGKVILKEQKDVLIYEYGIARMKTSDFENLNKFDFQASRQRGLQYDVLIKNKNQFQQIYPNIIIDNATIDEILRLLTKEEA